MINCTPHPITLLVSGESRTIEPSGTVARIDMIETVTTDIVAGVPVITRKPGLVVGLPRDEQGRILPCIVSSMVLDALPAGTKNVFAPDTGATAVRNEKGHVMAVTRLVKK